MQHRVLIDKLYLSVVSRMLFSSVMQRTMTIPEYVAASQDTEKMINKTRIAIQAVNLFLVNDLIRRKEILLK